MKQYTAEELNALSKEEVVALLIQTQKQNALFMEQIATMQAQRFGRKTERLECLGQLSCFNEAEIEAAKDTDEPETEEISYTRKKRTPGKLDEMLKGLPSRVENHELSEEELTELFGTNGWKRLPDEVYRKLEYHPATKEVVEHHIAVYASKTEDQIVRTPHPAELLVHSIATPSLVAAIMNAKYTNALPLYRIGQEFERYDVKIPVPTMANWVIRCAERYLYPVIDRMQVELRRLPVIQADETVCKVSKDDRPANAESRMFVYRSGEYEQEKVIVLFDYQKTRKAEHIENFLGDFSGVLVSDAYSGYHSLDRKREDIQVANCWAHARRDFADAVKALQKKGGPSKQRIKKTVAYQALERIGSLFALEEDWKDLTAEERYARRQQHSKPLVEAYFAWVKSIDPETVVSEKTRKGLQYSINQEKYLCVFLENGAVPLDNSASERAIRPFCVGRANWHIIDSVKGAQASAAVYSIVETAKANRLKPYEYLKFLLSEMPKHMETTNYSFLDDLLPWSALIPDVCKKNT
jgi:transposase